PPDSWDRILFDRPLLGLGIGIFALFILFGPLVALLVSVIHMVGYLLLSAAVNAIGHTFGDRPYENGATNNNWLAIMTCGEGLHNNHHAVPTAARLSFKRAQIDTGWWTIKFLEKIGQAKVRLSMPKILSSASPSSL
ncbi:MAG: acyl-CoA desaturase, partial [Acidimicrobiaceae bacterium]|nr:acyl-CoA desaturase [Acidimicrobiaceae bacterium]